MRLVILHEGDNPTLGYFGAPIESMYAGLPALKVDISKRPEDIRLASGDVVVIVRYLNGSWCAALRKKKPNLAGLIYFMDDDLLDRLAIENLPNDYKKRIKEKSIKYRNWLCTYCSEIWVSSEYLAQKYSFLSPKVLNPLPLSVAKLPKPIIRIAYHGSASHYEELIWLRPIFEEVLHHNENVHLQIFGDKIINKIYRELPRVSVIQPMVWENYFVYTSFNKVDIFLAPLLDNPFNKSRTYTKFYDAARMGAAGIYTDLEPYKGFVKNDIDGLLVKNEKTAWIDSLTLLIINKDKRVKIAEACKNRLNNLN